MFLNELTAVGLRRLQHEKILVSKLMPEKHLNRYPRHKAKSTGFNRKQNKMERKK